MTRHFSGSKAPQLLSTVNEATTACRQVFRPFFRPGIACFFHALALTDFLTQLRRFRITLTLHIVALTSDLVCKRKFSPASSSQRHRGASGHRRWMYRGVLDRNTPGPRRRIKRVYAYRCSSHFRRCHGSLLLTRPTLSPTECSAGPTPRQSGSHQTKVNLRW
jgi:hypothetical protein